MCLRAASATPTLASCEIALASSADWLKRRAHSRRQCSGTGISASALVSSLRPARAIQRPMVGARSSRSPYFSECTSAQRRRSARRRGRGGRPADRRSLASTARRGRGRRQRVYRAVRNKVARSATASTSTARQAVAADRLSAGGVKRRQGYMERAAEKRVERRRHAHAARRIYARGNRFLYWF